jgi:hypothetical protein
MMSMAGMMRMARGWFMGRKCRESGAHEQRHLEKQKPRLGGAGLWNGQLGPCMLELLTCAMMPELIMGSE